MHSGSIHTERFNPAEGFQHNRIPQPSHTEHVGAVPWLVDIYKLLYIPINYQANRYAVISSTG